MLLAGSQSPMVCYQFCFHKMPLYLTEFSVMRSEFLIPFMSHGIEVIMMYKLVLYFKRSLKFFQAAWSTGQSRRMYRFVFPYLMTSISTACYLNLSCGCLLCWWLFVEMVEPEHTNLWYYKSIVTFNLLCHLFEKLKSPFASKFDYINVCMLWLHIAQKSREH